MMISSTNLHAFNLFIKISRTVSSPLRGFNTYPGNREEFILACIIIPILGVFILIFIENIN